MVPRAVVPPPEGDRLNAYPSSRVALQLQWHCAHLESSLNSRPKRFRESRNGDEKLCLV